MKNIESIHVEVPRPNQNGHWELEEYNALSDIIAIKAINESIIASEIYDGAGVAD